MPVGHILFHDPMLSGWLITNSLTQAYGLRPIVITDLFRSELKTRSRLSLEINGFLQRGELVPPATVEKLILKYMDPQNDFVLTGYPRTNDQLESIMESMSTQNVKIERLWLFKSDNPDAALNDKIHFLKLQWSEEAIAEFQRKQLSSYELFRRSMDEMVNSHKELWTIIHVSNDEFRDKQRILNKIKSSGL